MSVHGQARFGFTPRSNNWTSLRLINTYRVALASGFFAQSFLPESPLFTVYNLTVFAWSSFAYLLVALVIMLSSWIDRRNFQLQVSLQIYLDIIAIILLMHACGGISSGIGMLLVISIVGAGFLGEYPLGIVFAAIASVGLLTEHLYAVNYTFYSGNSTQVGILGATLMATALVTQSLARRIRSSEALIHQQKLDVANLSTLNAQIIQNMQSGIIAMDAEDQIRHINDTAVELLKSRIPSLSAPLEFPLELSIVLPDLYSHLQEWRQSRVLSKRFVSNVADHPDIQVSFSKLESRSHTGTLIFLDDVSTLKQQMQQAKLASLGQLTANIAHEIRNPLGAISHAGQLLGENPDLPTTEKRLTEIIQQHTQRINDIIEDIMQISRGQTPSSDTITLHDWMENFIDTYCSGNESEQNCLTFESKDSDSLIRFDSSHLERILTNLCNNAKMHGNTDLPILIQAFDRQNNKVAIEIADHGPGIDDDLADKIFEPFFTTSHKGTGLGLYIVSQLCELNRASISVAPNEIGGTSFFIDVEKKHE